MDCRRRGHEPEAHKSAARWPATALQCGVQEGWMMGALLRPELLSITDLQALHRPRELLLARAATLYRAARLDDAQDPALRVRCHALAWRHLHEEAARARVAPAFAALPALAATPEAQLPDALATCALALAAGVEEAGQALERAWISMEKLAWSAHREQYAAPVRNAAACAALLTAFETGGDLRYLRRAETLCRTVTARTPPAPPAHCQWALSLLRLARHPVALAHPGSWMVPHAKRLFDTAAPALLHETRFAPLALALAVATSIAARTGAPRRLQWQERLWKLCWHGCRDLRDGDPEAAAAVLQAVDQLSPRW
jgi:hypothetical protein